MSPLVPRLALLTFLAIAATARAQTGLPLQTRWDAGSTPNALAATKTGEDRVVILADGSIRKTLSEKLAGSTAAEDGDPPSDGYTRLGVTKYFASEHQVLSGIISLASTQKVIDSGYTNAVVTPGIGSGFHASLLEWRRTFTGPTVTGDSKRDQTLGFRSFLHFLYRDLHAYGTVAVSDWSLPVSTTSTEQVNAVIFGGGIMRVFRLIEDERASSPIGMSVEVGLSVRSLAGDITLDGFRDARTAVLGTGKENFGGLEGGMQVQVGDVVAFFHLYDFWAPDDVRGLTKTQVLTGINVRAPIFDSAH